MKPETKHAPAPENRTAFQNEMAATKAIHNALLSVASERREPILRAVAILLKIDLPDYRG